MKAGDDMVLFSKYHGCGNSFVIIKEEDILKATDETGYSDFARMACDVNTGVGADGMIVVRRQPALEMVFFNRDGSRAPMCGNGIRCFANFCRDENIEDRTRYPVKTLAGDMIVDVTCDEPFRVRINMGKPIFEPQAVKVDPEILRDAGGKDLLGRHLTLQDGRDVEINSLFMGTIHTVVFVDDFDDMDIPKVGEEICEHPVFSEKTNVNFVKPIDDETLEVRTYERGVGMTLACGTGACASVVVASMKGLCGSSAEVRLKLGSLGIEIDGSGDVYMEGPSVKIMDGKLLNAAASGNENDV